jgi:hypothetical protein
MYVWQGSASKGHRASHVDEMIHTIVDQHDALASLDLAIEP